MSIENALREISEFLHSDAGEFRSQADWDDRRKEVLDVYFYRVHDHITETLNANAVWQPIETAPMDTMVWIFLPHNHGDYMFHAMKTNQYGEDGIGWFVHGDELLDGSPTHWMPLPPAPEAKS